MKILSYLIALLLFFSCSSPETQKLQPEQKSLKPQSFIPEVPENLPEISGLIVYDDLFWGFNDSGGKNKLYGFDKKGEIQKEIEIKNANNRDWESIAQDDENIYVGDFGNNGGSREGLCIYKLDKSDINKESEQEVKADKISFNYASQTRFTYFNNTTPYDCEALIEFKNSLYIFSKNWKELTSTVYKIPTEKGDYTIHPLDSFNVDGLITGADISPDKKHLALVGYNNYKSFIWLFSSFPEDSFFQGEAQFLWLEGLNNAQTEGICFLDNNKLLVSCEATSAFRQQVFLFDITEVIDGTH